jgi:hypothetical protein
MTLAELRAFTKTLAKWLAATTSLVFAFSRFLPSGRPGGYNIVDDSWIQMLHTAFVERLFTIERAQPAFWEGKSRAGLRLET